MINLFQTLASTLTLNPTMLILAGAAVALLIMASRKWGSAIVPQLSLDTAATISVAATSTFAVLTSVQAIAAGPLA